MALSVSLSPLFMVTGADPAVAASAQADGAGRRTEAQAVAAAHRSGKRVEVLGARTETRQVFANPDGTFTSETFALPQRVRRSGKWVAVDTTLKFASDGSVRPVATSVGMSFSGGGNAPLATMAEHGRSFGMTWPKKLPRPVLERNTATYRSVLPDVDLKITASELGYSEVLVVKTRKAAANPALSTLGFGLKGKNLSVRKEPTGALSVVTDKGLPVFTSQVPRMWDSSGHGEVGARSLAVAPHPGGRQAVVGVQVGAGRLDLVPDRRVLADPAVKYPVYIDPQWPGSKLAWAMVDRAWENTPDFNSSHMPEAGNYGSGVKRSFFRMDSNNVNGKHILKATFRITQVKSWGCNSNPQGVEVWLTGAISSSTTWNHQPKWDTFQDSVASDAGYSSSCPDAGIEFNVTNAITRAAKGGWTNTVLGIKDYDDLNSNEYGWKGFSSSPSLVVDYNTPPSAPSGVGTTPGTPCVTGANRPYINAGDVDNPITLQAKIYDPDKANDSVRAEFVMHHYNSGTGVWDDITSSLHSGGKTAYKSTTTATTHSVQAPVLTNAHSYSYRVKAFDGTDSSPWSSWCEFTVDTVDPLSVPQVSSADYPANVPDEPHGGVGDAGAFTLTPGQNETDIAGFRFALDDKTDATAATQVSIPTGQTSVQVQVAPLHDWMNTLYVYAVDRAGNVGANYATYDFWVQPGRAPIGHWTMNETSGTTAADSAGANPLTLSGGTSWARARVEGGLNLNGSTGYGSTSAPVIPDTTKSFSVSAWVRLPATAPSTTGTIVSQAGASKSAFLLKWEASSGKWSFMRPNDDGQVAGPSSSVASTQPAELNTWTHLVAVYDATKKEMRLNVNGVENTKVAFSSAWKAMDALQIGRLKWNGGQQIDYFTGAIDDVRVWDRILSDGAGALRWPPTRSRCWPSGRPGRWAGGR